MSNSVTITNPNPYGGFATNFTLMPAAVKNVQIPYNSGAPLLYQYIDSVILGFSFHITASQPVSVYGVDYSYQASWAFTALPTPMLGTNYCLMARPSLDFYTNSSQFAIVATADGTTVIIKPSTNANLATHDGGFYTNAYTNFMNQGDSYHISSGSWSNDVTGTWITSDKPIAVFAGADDALVPYATTDSGNPLVQEQLPVASWGNDVLALSFADRTGGDSYRVLTATDGTTLTVVTSNGVATNTLHALVPYDTILDGWVEFKANNPIQVAQFANGCTFDGPNNVLGDPLEILLPPTGHYLNSYTVAIPPDDGQNGTFDRNFVNLIAPNSNVSTIMFDGTNVSTNIFLAIGNSGYSGARLSVAAGTNYTITCPQPIEVEVYGFTDNAFGWGG